MPISPVDTTWQDGGTLVRTQLPLRLCWAITMQKSQGQTLDKAVTDLGPKEACTGLTFVCLSRTKRLVDLMVAHQCSARGHTRLTTVTSISCRSL